MKIQFEEILFLKIQFKEILFKKIQYRNIIILKIGKICIGRILEDVHL